MEVAPWVSACLVIMRCWFFLLISFPILGTLLLSILIQAPLLVRIKATKWTLTALPGAKQAQNAFNELKYAAAMKTIHYFQVCSWCS